MLRGPFCFYATDLVGLHLYFASNDIAHRTSVFLYLPRAPVAAGSATTVVGNAMTLR